MTDEKWQVEIEVAPFNRGLRYARSKREYETNGNDGTDGISLGFSVCSVLSVCSVFSYSLHNRYTTIKRGATEIETPDLLISGAGL
jgi:hypothetical protein